MAGEAATVARFGGAVSCVRDAHGPLGLTLSGRDSSPDGEQLTLAFTAAAPDGLPARLEDALIERTGPGAYRIASGAHAWTLEARSVHLHREVAQRFYRAIPPRPAPLVRRVLFAAMLGLARSRAAIALLKALPR